LVGVLLTRAISAVTAVLLAHLFFAAIAVAESTVTYQEHVDHPELYPLPAPAKKNIDIMVTLRPHVTSDNVRPLSDWLTGAGFRIVDGDEKSGYLHISGSVEDAEDTFQTEIRMTQWGTYGNLSDPKIPARLANVVQSISGLTEATLGHQGPIHARRMPTPQPHSRISPSSDLRMKSGRLERSIFRSAYGSVS
jgi:hypothetical protein